MDKMYILLGKHTENYGNTKKREDGKAQRFLILVAPDAPPNISLYLRILYE